MGFIHINLFSEGMTGPPNLFTALRCHQSEGERLYTSEYDVYRRQILSYKHGLREFLGVVDP